MAENITIRAADHLYWLGRYLQRGETMIAESLNAYDYVIDRNFAQGQELFAKLGLSFEYKNAKEFLYMATYGDNHSSIAYNFEMARENAIICRDLIDDRGFGFLNHIHNSLQASREKEISSYLLEDMLNDTQTTLGIFFSEIYRPEAYHFIKFGQYIERVDLMVRIFDSLEMILLDTQKINILGHKLNLNFKEVKLTFSDRARVSALFNSLIGQIIVCEN